MAVAELGPVVLDCPDPRALARFYADVLGGTVEGEGDWVDLRLPGGRALAFQAAPGFVPPKWPAPDDSPRCSTRPPPPPASWPAAPAAGSGASPRPKP
ncbi:VOC family protein, partial [Streptomyces violaceoruber]